MQLDEVVAAAEPEAAAVGVGCYSEHWKSHVAFPSISFPLHAVVGGCKQMNNLNVCFDVKNGLFYNYKSVTIN